MENGTQFGGLTVGEWDSDGWQFSKLTEFRWIRAMRQLFYELKDHAGFGNNSLLLGGNASGELPNSIVWDDTTN
ncbi:MAG: hypothetical protein R3C26_17615 [Calditrichia bacterium]